MSALPWKDITSHTQGAKDRTPRTWEARAGAFRIVVTRHAHHPPDAWVLRAEPWFSEHLLGNVSIEEAKAMAIKLVTDKLADALRIAMGEA